MTDATGGTLVAARNNNSGCSTTWLSLCYVGSALEAAVLSILLDCTRTWLSTTPLSSPLLSRGPEVCTDCTLFAGHQPSVITHLKKAVLQEAFVVAHVLVGIAHLSASSKGRPRFPHQALPAGVLRAGLFCMPVEAARLLCGRTAASSVQH